MRSVGVEADALMGFAGVVVGRRVAGKDEHGRAIAGRGYHAGERVGEARGKVDVDDGEFVAGSEVAIGGMRGLLLMAERNVFDPQFVAGVDDAVVGVSALAEDFGYAFLLEAFANEHGSGQYVFLLMWGGL